jgi:hypothetical protein
MIRCWFNVNVPPPLLQPLAALAATASAHAPTATVPAYASLM